ncbi:hypothetical protein SteCoe_6172 [Stentor coeruleus]|uniref:Jacalin-type lectin domain-containing protein n=1 Tax=Stentor coeruleus TaxID=5963 RepID=A0A1R2CQK3_9CILI|nr:hypothetical protein SteCoe_6172 [Stentor coeruleus]
MHIFSLRRIFRALHGVKYTTCEHCNEPISSASSLHTCNLKAIPLQFYYTKLTESSRSIRFYDRCPGRSFLHEINIWATNYISGLEVKIEDLQSKKIQVLKHGETVGKLYRFSLENGEFITKIDYGCDFHGMYYISLKSDRKEMKIGDFNRPKKSIELPDGCGMVGVFGGHTEVVLHLGFYFDSKAEVNWKRHRELLLIRSKGQVKEDNDLGMILKLDDSLVRYLAAFI